MRALPPCGYRMEREGMIRAYLKLRLGSLVERRGLALAALSETFMHVWCLIKKVDTRMRNVESISQFQI